METRYVELPIHRYTRSLTPLLPEPSPIRMVLGSWIAAGLASEATKFSIHLSWGTKQVNAFLRVHFPVLFGYFNTTVPRFQDIPDEPDSVGMKKLNYQLPYILLKKNRKNYSLVDESHPTAETYQEYLAGANRTAGFKAKTLYLGESTSSEHPNVCILTDLQSYQGTYPTRGY